MTLRNLIYTSRTTRALSSVELDAILQDARAFNAGEGVTGVLFYAAGHFFQFLEGEPAAVERVLERLRPARCHTELAVLLDATATERQFADWHMAFAEPPESELQALATSTWNESVPITRTSFAKPQALGLVLSCWSRWAAGYVGATV